MNSSSREGNELIPKAYWTSAPKEGPNPIGFPPTRNSGKVQGGGHSGEPGGRGFVQRALVGTLWPLGGAQHSTTLGQE